MMHFNNPIVRLWQINGVGLILLHKSGIFYTNQTGGHSCSHPEAEGIFIPLVDEMVNQQDLLFQHFTGPKWAGWCNDGIDVESAVVIDQILDKSSHTKFLKVDHGRLADSHEAWVYVTIESPPDPDALPWKGFASMKGILTWENSD